MIQRVTVLRTMTAFSTVGLALLSACSDKAPEAPATTAAAASAPAPSTPRAPQAPAAEPKAPEPAKAPDTVASKLEAYIECYNSVDTRAHDSIRRYASWIKDMKVGPTGKERLVYGLYTLSDSSVASCQKDVTAAAALTPAVANLDDAARAYVAALMPLNEKINEADKYYERQNYKDDKFAQGKAMHAPLAQAMKDFDAASSAFSKALDVENDKQLAAQLQRVEQAEGRKWQYWRMATMAEAKRLVQILSDDTFNVEEATTKMAAFEKAADELAAYAKAHEDEIPMMGSMMDSEVESFRVAAKERLRRVRDKTPYSTGERMNVGTQGEWMVNGSPGKLVREYNQLISASNRTH